MKTVKSKMTRQFADKAKAGLRGYADGTPPLLKTRDQQIADAVGGATAVAPPPVPGSPVLPSAPVPPPAPKVDMTGVQQATPEELAQQAAFKAKYLAPKKNIFGFADGGIVDERMKKMEEIAGNTSVSALPEGPDFSNVTSGSSTTAGNEDMVAWEQRMRAKPPSALDKAKSLFGFADGGAVRADQIAAQAGFPMTPPAQPSLRSISPMAPVAPTAPPEFGIRMPPGSTTANQISREAGFPMTPPAPPMQVRPAPPMGGGGVRAANGGSIHVGPGAVHGPGGPTADRVPAMLSNKEYVLPADTVAHVGRENLDHLVAGTHRPTGRPSGMRHFADGTAPLLDEFGRPIPPEAAPAQGLRTPGFVQRGVDAVKGAGNWIANLGSKPVPETGPAGGTVVPPRAAPAWNTIEGLNEALGRGTSAPAVNTDAVPPRGPVSTMANRVGTGIRAAVPEGALGKVAGAAAATAAPASTYWSAIADDKLPTSTKIKMIGDIAARGAGAIVGGSAGAVLGSGLPGPGTVIGGVGGAVAGERAVDAASGGLRRGVNAASGALGFDPNLISSINDDMTKAGYNPNPNLAEMVHGNPKGGVSPLLEEDAAAQAAKEEAAPLRRIAVPDNLPEGSASSASKPLESGSYIDENGRQQVTIGFTGRGPDLRARGRVDEDGRAWLPSDRVDVPGSASYEAAVKNYENGVRNAKMNNTDDVVWVSDPASGGMVQMSRKVAEARGADAKARAMDPRNHPAYRAAEDAAISAKYASSPRTQTPGLGFGGVVMNAMRTRAAKQDARFQAGLDLRDRESLRSEDTARMRDILTARGQDIQTRGQDVQTRGQDIQEHIAELKARQELADKTRKEQIEQREKTDQRIESHPAFEGVNEKGQPTGKADPTKYKNFLDRMSQLKGKDGKPVDFYNLSKQEQNQLVHDYSVDAANYDAGLKRAAERKLATRPTEMGKYKEAGKIGWGDIGKPDFSTGDILDAKLNPFSRDIASEKVEDASGNQYPLDRIVAPGGVYNAEQNDRIMTSSGVDRGTLRNMHRKLTEEAIRAKREPPTMDQVKELLKKAAGRS